MRDRHNAYQGISEYRNKPIKTDKLGYVVRLILSTHASGPINTRLILKTTESGSFKLEELIKTNSLKTLEELCMTVWDYIETLNLDFKTKLSRSKFIEDCKSYYYLESKESLKRLMTSTEAYKNKVNNTVNNLVTKYNSGIDRSALTVEVQRLVDNYYIKGTGNVAFDHFGYINAHIIASSIKTSVAQVVYALSATKATKGMVNESKVTIRDNSIPDFIIKREMLDDIRFFHIQFGQSVCYLANLAVLEHLSGKYGLDKSSILTNQGGTGRIKAFMSLFREFHIAQKDRNSVRYTGIISRIKARFNNTSTFKIIGSSQSRANKSLISFEIFIKALQVVDNLFEYILATGKVPEFTMLDLKEIPPSNDDVNVTNISEYKRTRELLIESIDIEQTKRFSDLVGHRFIDGIDNVVNPIVNNIGRLSITDKTSTIKKSLPIAPMFVKTGVINGVVVQKIKMNPEGRVIAEVYKCPYIERKPEYSRKIHQEDKKSYQVFPTSLDRLTTDLNLFNYYTLMGLFANIPVKNTHIDKVTRVPQINEFVSARSIVDPKIQAPDISRRARVLTNDLDAMNDFLFKKLEDVGFNLEDSSVNLTQNTNLYLQEPFLPQKSCLDAFEETLGEVRKVRDSHLQVLMKRYSYLLNNANKIQSSSKEMTPEEAYESIPDRLTPLVNSLIHDSLKLEAGDSLQVSVLGLPYPYKLYDKYFMGRGTVSSRLDSINKELKYYSDLATSISRLYGNLRSSGVTDFSGVWNEAISRIKFNTIEPKDQVTGKELEGLYNTIVGYISKLREEAKDYRYVPAVYRNYIYDNRVEAYDSGNIGQLAKTSITSISGNKELIKEMVSSSDNLVKDILYSDDRFLSLDGKNIFLDIGTSILNGARKGINQLATIHSVFGSTGMGVTELTPSTVEYRINLMYDFAENFRTIPDIPDKIAGVGEAMKRFRMHKRNRPALAKKIQTNQSFVKRTLAEIFDNSTILVFDSILRKESYLIQHNSYFYKIQRGGLYRVDIENNTEVSIDINSITDAELKDKIGKAITNTPGSAFVSKNPMAILTDTYIDYIKVNATADDKYIVDGVACKITDLVNLFNFLKDIATFYIAFEDTSGIQGLDKLKYANSCIDIFKYYLNYMDTQRDHRMSPDDIVTRTYKIIDNMISVIKGPLRDGKDLSNEYKVFGDYSRVSHVKENALKFNNTIMDKPDKEGIAEITAYVQGHNIVSNSTRPIQVCPQSNVYVYSIDESEPFLVQYRNKVYGISAYGYLIPDDAIIPGMAPNQELTFSKLMEYRIANPIYPIGKLSIKKLRDDYTTSV